MVGSETIDPVITEIITTVGALLDILLMQPSKYVTTDITRLLYVCMYVVAKQFTWS